MDMLLTKNIVEVEGLIICPVLIRVIIGSPVDPPAGTSNCVNFPSINGSCQKRYDRGESHRQCGLNMNSKDCHGKLTNSLLVTISPLTWSYWVAIHCISLCSYLLSGRWKVWIKCIPPLKPIYCDQLRISLIARHLRTLPRSRLQPKILTTPYFKPFKTREAFH